MRPAMLLITTALVLATAVPAVAASTDKAAAAIQKGDYERALAELRPLAEKNDDRAQCFLGMMYAQAQGVPRDSTLAIEWLTKSAAQRNTRAMGMLAVELFGRAPDDEQSLIDAYVWSHLAAESDPIQAATSARGVIEGYCNADQTARAKQSMAEWKKRWAKQHLKAHY